MSRNKEKAQSALNRFQAYKNKEAGILQSDPSLRPKYVQKVTSIPQAEKWRSTIISEISTKLARIQDPIINESTIRELNDELNQLFNQKRSWEYHIKNLGGNDYIHFGNDNDLTKSGIRIRGGGGDGSQSKGYRYFGRAKDLPDVKKLIEAQKQQRLQVKKGGQKQQQVQEENNRKQRIDLSYYGYFDETNSEDDPLLVYEKKRSNELLPQEPRTEYDQPQEEIIYDFESILPTNEMVSQWLVDRRRKQLLERIGQID
ncbi:ISY1 [[Candida] subhashii]|uniref:Pre-mRNA-splicing factor ISY1 n=1 Tax=[Candida] subhashii TaxID=561895 RepID=A0A8J5V422_9ASCO|nr:ISY1 [[Candida] subhashii]KAG7666380.1 ISY1 [[Candida] subhashii]